MKAIFAIAGKEFKSFVYSPTYLITSGFFVAFLSFSYLISFQAFVERAQRGNMNMFAQVQSMNFHDTVVLEHINWVNLLFLLFVPLLMSRLLAEEKKLNSFDLLMTSPITSFQIVVGKYLGGLFAILVLILIASIYPASASLFADVQWLKMGSAFLGLFFAASIYAAVGLFCSSLTQSMIVATIGGVLINMGLWIVAFFRLHAEEEWSIALVDHVSLGIHLDAFLKGVVGSSSIVFCLSVILFFAFLSERIVESHRWRS